MPTEKNSISFLQISDVLLDARLSFKGMAMTATKRHERNIEALEAVLALCEEAKSGDADALVVVGNLWDGQSVTAATVARLVDAFASMGEIPVLICPGATDPLSPQSLYNSSVLSAFAVRPWSKNVHVFGAAEPTAWIPPSRPDVCFVGRACMGAPAPSALLAPGSTGDASCIIRLEYAGAEVEAADAAVTDVYAYTAFGGCENFTEVRAADGTVRGAAAGSLIGRSLTELGRRTALWVQLSASDSGSAYKIAIARMTADGRQLVSTSVNINGIRGAQVHEHLRKAVESSGATPSDLLHLKVTGIYPKGSEPDFGGAQLAKMVYHLILEDATRPDYYLDKMDPRTTEGRFIQYLQNIKVTAESRGGTVAGPVDGTEYGTALTPDIIEDALYYGLEALNQKKVTVPDVD